MLKASGEKVDVAIKAMKGRCGIFKNRDLILFLKIIDVCTAVCTAIHRNLIFYIFLMKSCVYVLFLALTLLLMINLPYQFFISVWANGLACILIDHLSASLSLPFSLPPFLLSLSLPLSYRCLYC